MKTNSPRLQKANNLVGIGRALYKITVMSFRMSAMGETQIMHKLESYKMESLRRRRHLGFEG